MASMLLLCASAAGAVDVDLTTAGASGAVGAGSFLQVHLQPTGTGVIDPFVRLQNKDQEQGFNTDHSPLNGDLIDVKAGTWTHSLRVSELTPVMYEGVLSARFLLDINQTNTDPLLSLDELRVYTAPTGDLADNASLFAQNLIYDMGAGNRVLLDYSLEAGSGSGDMYFYLPYSLFTGLGSQFLYLYSKFGASGGNYATNDGFEEWAHLTFPTPTQRSTWSRVKGIYR